MLAEPGIISRLAGEVISEGLQDAQNGCRSVLGVSFFTSSEFMQTVEKFFKKKLSISYNHSFTAEDITVKKPGYFKPRNSMESLDVRGAQLICNIDIRALDPF